MRYIANENGYLQQVSFGADITCGGTDCTEYTGAVPAGYKNLEDWYHQEGEKLYRWKIASGQLTLDSGATAPTDFKEPIESATYPGCYYRVIDGETEWVNPPMVADVIYRTTERANGLPVYASRFTLDSLPNKMYAGKYVVPYGGAKVQAVISTHGVATRGIQNYDFPVVLNGAVVASLYANIAANGGLAAYALTTTDMTGYSCYIDCKWIYD